MNAGARIGGAVLPEFTITFVRHTGTTFSSFAKTAGFIGTGIKLLKVGESGVQNPVLREDMSGSYLLDSDSLAFIDDYYKVKIKILKSGLLRSDTISQQYRYTDSMLKLF